MPTTPKSIAMSQRLSVLLLGLGLAAPGSPASAGATPDGEPAPDAPEEPALEEPRPAGASSSPDRGALEAAWARIEQGQLTRAELLLQGILDTDDASLTIEAYFALSEVWWERLNALAAYEWLHRAEAEVRQNGWRFADDDPWTARIAKRRAWLESNCTLVHLELPVGGPPLAPFTLTPPADPTIRTLAAGAEQAVREAAERGLPALWLLIPKGVYSTGADETVLADAPFDPTVPRHLVLSIDPIYEERPRPELPQGVLADINTTFGSSSLADGFGYRVRRVAPPRPKGLMPQAWSSVTDMNARAVSQALSEEPFGQTFAMQYRAITYSPFSRHGWFFPDLGVGLWFEGSKVTIQPQEGLTPVAVALDELWPWHPDGAINRVEAVFDGIELTVTVNGRALRPVLVRDRMASAIGGWRLSLPFGETDVEGLWIEHWMGD